MFAIVAAALCAVAAAAAPPPASRDARRVYRPVPPEAEYYRLKHLMANGMMPNYKAVWYGFRHDDRPAMAEALGDMTLLARQVDRYPPPKPADAPKPDVEEFRRWMLGLADQTDALRADLPRLADRAAVSARILSIYGSCQKCHDRYAPEEGKERRKYSPPSD